jgi:hypothetical protein
MLRKATGPAVMSTPTSCDQINETPAPKDRPVSGHVSVPPYGDLDAPDMLPEHSHSNSVARKSRKPSQEAVKGLSVIRHVVPVHVFKKRVYFALLGSISLHGSNEVFVRRDQLQPRLLNRVKKVAAAIGCSNGIESDKQESSWLQHTQALP